MERKSSTLSSSVDNHKNTNSHDQLVVKKVKSRTRWFNSIMTIEIVGICICLGLMIALAIINSLS